MVDNDIPITQTGISYKAVIYKRSKIWGFFVTISEAGNVYWHSVGWSQMPESLLCVGQSHTTKNCSIISMTQQYSLGMLEPEALCPLAQTELEIHKDQWMKQKQLVHKPMKKEGIDQTELLKRSSQSHNANTPTLNRNPAA